MSITRSDHTNDLSSAWRARYYSETTDPGGKHYRVEFIDSDTSAPGASEFGLSATPLEPHSVKMSEGSLTLKWDGDTDHIAAAIVPSHLEVTFQMENTNHEKLIDAIEGAEDGRYGLALYKVNDAGTAWEPFWVGVLNAEAVEWDLRDNPFSFKLSASCGINRLSEIEYLDSSSARYEGFETLIEMIRNCIEKIPTYSFWLSTDTVFSEVVEMVNLESHFDTATFLGAAGDLTATQTWPTTYSAGDAYPDSVLERTLASSAVWYEDVEPEQDKYGRRIYRSTSQPMCMEVLESIARAFGFRFFLRGFSFWALPPNVYNWSYELNAKLYTKSIFDGSEIRMPGGSESSTTSLIDHEVDLETDHQLVDGLTQSYMLPQKSVAIQFNNAGRRSVFGPAIHEYLGDDRGILVSESETGSIIGTDQPITLKFNYQLLPSHLIQTATDAAAETAGTDRIGAHIIIRVKLKLGAYYLVSEHSVSSTVTNTINLLDVAALGTSLTAKLITIPESIEWSLTEGYCDFVVPWGAIVTNQNQVATQFVDDDGNVHYSGLHTFIDGWQEFKFDNGFTQTAWSYTNIELECPSFPEGVSSLTGATLTAERIVIKYDGTELTTLAELDNVFNTVSSDAYVSGTQEVCKDRITQLRLFIGEDGEGTDLVTTASCDENIETLDLGHTLLGDNAVDQVPSSNGALRAFYDDLSDLSALGHYPAEYWQSLTEFADTTSDPVSTLHVVLTREMLYSRCEALRIQRGQISQIWDTSRDTDPLQFTSVLTHNCSTAADEVEYFALLTLAWNITQGVYDVEMYRIKRVISGTYVPDEDTDDGGGGSDDGGGGWPDDGEVGLSRAERDRRVNDPQRTLNRVVSRAVPADYEDEPRLRLQSLSTVDGVPTPGEGVQLKAADDMGNEYKLTLPEADDPADGQLPTVDSVSGSPAEIITKWRYPQMLIVTESTTSRTLGLTDQSKCIICTNSSAVTITVPPESTTDFDQGTVITLAQTGSGQVEVAEGSGVTVNNANGLKTAAQYTAITLIKYGVNTWLLWGESTT